jgi:vitamin B12 transporter
MTRYNRFLLASTASLLVTTSSAAPLQAQETAVSALPEVVVTANRVPTELRRVAGSVTVIDAEELQRRNQPLLADVLRTVPGVDVVRSGGRGQTTTVLLRGNKSEHTLVLIDGVRVNDPSSTSNLFDFAHLTTDNIERVEIVRGPQGMLYGSDAIGGVINIITKTGKGKPAFTFSAEGGSYNSFRGSAGVNGGTDATQYGFNISRFHTSGFSAYNEERGGIEDDGTRNMNFSGRLSHRWNEAVSADFAMRLNDNATEYDDFAANADNEVEGQQFSGRAALNLALMEERWKQTVAVSHVMSHNDRRTIFGDYDSRGERQKLEWLNEVNALANHRFTFGAEGEQEAFRSTFSRRESMNNFALLAQDQITLGDAFSVAIGGRWDNPEAFEDEATWRISPVYELDATGTRFTASYGTAFKAPSLYQLFDGFVGNRSLKPETSKGYDIGVEQSLWQDRVVLSAVWFHNEVENLLDYSFLQNRYVNTGESRMQGVETGLTYRPSEVWEFGLNYTYTDAEDRQTGLRLLRRPEHKVGVRADYFFLEKGRIGTDIAWIGEREDVNALGLRTGLDSYTLVNLSAGWQLLPNAELTARIENLLDEEYEEVFSYGTAGISGFAGVRLNF